jgi:hypothetical protein
MDTIHPTTIGRRSADPREQDLDLDGLFAALFSDDGAQDPYPFLRRYHGPGVTTASRFGSCTIAASATGRCRHRSMRCGAALVAG